MNSRNRNFALDNIKFLLIILVVFGHLIEPLINQNVIFKTVYLSIYSFHMPLFILISGMLTKLVYTKEQLHKTIIDILIPFLSFTILYEIFNLMIYGHISSATLNFEPYRILWFLFSLLLYKIFLPIIMKFKYPILFSIIISLIAGYVTSVGQFLSISRILYFLPFFIIGYTLTPALLSNNRLMKIPKIFFMIILILNIILFYYMNNISHQWLFGSFSYDRLNMSEWFSWIIRLGIYIISFLTSISILMLIPNKKLSISKFGKNSLYVYVWHYFFIKLVLGLGFISFLGYIPTYEAIIVLLFMAVIVTIFLSLDFIKKVTENSIHKRISNLFFK